MIFSISADGIGSILLSPICIADSVAESEKMSYNHPRKKFYSILLGGGSFEMAKGKKKESFWNVDDL